MLLLSYPVASFACRPCLPPAQTVLWVLSSSLSQRGEEAIDPGGVLHMPARSHVASSHSCLCHQFERSLLQKVVAASRTSLPHEREASRACDRNEGAYR